MIHLGVQRPLGQRLLASKAVFGSAPPSSWSRSASGMRGVLRRAIGNLLGIHYGRPHTEIPTLPGAPLSRPLLLLAASQSRPSPVGHKSSPASSKAPSRGLIPTA